MLMRDVVTRDGYIHTHTRQAANQRLVHLTTFHVTEREKEKNRGYLITYYYVTQRH